RRITEPSVNASRHSKIFATTRPLLRRSIARSATVRQNDPHGTVGDVEPGRRSSDHGETATETEPPERLPASARREQMIGFELDRGRDDEGVREPQARMPSSEDCGPAGDLTVG